MYVWVLRGSFPPSLTLVRLYSLFIQQRNIWTPVKELEVKKNYFQLTIVSVSTTSLSEGLPNTDICH